MDHTIREFHICCSLSLKLPCPIMAAAPLVCTVTLFVTPKEITGLKHSQFQRCLPLWYIIQMTCKTTWLENLRLYWICLNRLCCSIVCKIRDWYTITVLGDKDTVFKISAYVPPCIIFYPFTAAGSTNISSVLNGVIVFAVQATDETYVLIHYICTCHLTAIHDIYQYVKGKAKVHPKTGHEGIEGE